MDASEQAGSLMEVAAAMNSLSSYRSSIMHRQATCRHFACAGSRTTCVYSVCVCAEPLRDNICVGGYKVCPEVNDREPSVVSCYDPAHQGQVRWTGTRHQRRLKNPSCRPEI